MSSLLDEVKERGWLCGIPQNATVVGLMTGLSGIIYGLMRNIYNDIPNILAFELPKK